MFTAATERLHPLVGGRRSIAAAAVSMYMLVCGRFPRVAVSREIVKMLRYSSTGFESNCSGMRKHFVFDRQIPVKSAFSCKIEMA